MTMSHRWEGVKCCYGPHTQAPEGWAGRGQGLGPGPGGKGMRVEVMISGAHPGGLEGSGSELFSQLGTGRVTF